MKSAILALAFFSLSLPAFGQGVDPLIGTWKLNLEKSASIGVPLSRSAALISAAGGRNLIDTVEGIDAQGNSNYESTTYTPQLVQNLSQSGGTAEEARAMLAQAVAAVKADRDLALATINKGEGGYRDRGLYPFCNRISDGKNVGGPISVVATGTDLNAVKDSTGKLYGLAILAAAQKPEVEITEVSYMLYKPGTTAPVFQKVSFVTKVGDLIWGVGYYKAP
jgi:hypothetical protein